VIAQEEKVMTVFASRVGRITIAALCVTSVGSILTEAHAGPVVNFDVTVLGGTGGAYNNNFNSAGAPTANPELFNHSGTLNPTLDWNLLWNFNSDSVPSASGQQSLGAAFTFENTMADVANSAANHLHVIITTTLPVTLQGPPSMFGGNGAMTLTIRPSDFGNDGELNTSGNNPIWSYLINGASNASLYQSPFQLAGTSPAQGDSTLNTNQNLAGFQYNQLVSDIGIRIEFDLSPGEKVTFNGVFAFIPAPGALGLFGLAGLVGRGRRRRN
jgi:hypothetical protein